MPQKKKIWVRGIISICVLLVLVLLMYFVMHLFGIDRLDRVELQEYIKSKGAVAPIIYIIISFLQVTFIPIPAAVTIIAGNYVFGAFGAFLYSYIGMMLASILAFYLGRWIGRPFVNWLAGSADEVDLWLKKLRGREKVLLFYMFFLPIFPDDLLCSVAGILPISVGSFTVMQLVTRATSIGSTIIFMSGAVQGWLYVVALFIGAITVITFIYSFKNADKVNAIFLQISLGVKNLFKNKEQK